MQEVVHTPTEIEPNECFVGGGNELLDCRHGFSGAGVVRSQDYEDLRGPTALFWAAQPARCAGVLGAHREDNATRGGASAVRGAAKAIGAKDMAYRGGSQASRRLRHTLRPHAAPTGRVQQRAREKG